MAESVYDAPNRGSDMGKTRPDRLPLYQVAYDESQRALDEQANELDGMRQRATQFISFVGTATAFLVGTGVKSPDRDATFFVIALVGSLASLGTILLAVAILTLVRRSGWGFERFQWELRLSASRLVEWIEPDVGGPDEVDFMKAIALRQDQMRESNEVNLRVVRTRFLWLIILGSVQIVVWAALVWVKG